MSDRESSFSVAVAFSPDGYEVEGELSVSVLRYAVRSILGDLEDRVEQVENRVEDVERQLAQLKEEFEQQKQKWGEFERRAIRVRSHLDGALAYVRLFSSEHREKLDGVYLGWADNEYRFLFVTCTPVFDWDFSDELAELEAALVKDYEDLPISCKCVPTSVKDDLHAILQHKLATLTLKAPEKSDAVRS